MSAFAQIPYLGEAAKLLAAAQSFASSIPGGVVTAVEDEVLQLCQRTAGPRFAPVLTLANLQRAAAVAAEVEHAGADAVSFVEEMLGLLGPSEPAAPAPEPAAQ